MAKAKRAPSKAGSRAPAQRSDGWTNLVTGLGLAARDKRLGGEFKRGVKLDQITLEQMFHEEDLIARIVELPAQEMTREWIEIPGDADAKISGKLQELGVQAAFCEAETWGRLYGGGVIVLGAEDGQTYDQPLNLDNVKALDWIHVADRYDLVIDQYYDDPSKPKYGRAESYRWTSSSAAAAGSSGAAAAAVARVHESRILRFDGALTGRRRRLENAGWSESIVQRVYEVVRDFGAGHAGAALLLQDFSQAVFKVKDLAAMLAADQERVVLKRLQMLDLMRSIARAVPLDADGEEFERKSTTVTGMPDLLDRLGTRLAAATGMPITLLLGEAPGGLSATGNSDHRYWYNVVRNMQEMKFRKPLALLIKLIAKVVGAAPPQDQREWGFDFRPLWQPTEKEIAETRYLVAQTDALYIDRGVADPDEVAVSRFGGDQYSIETTIDLRHPPGQDPAPDKDPGDDGEDNVDPASGVPADKAVQDTALNGAQGEMLRNLLKDAMLGELPKETVKAAILAAFPSFDAAKVDAMLTPIKDEDIAAGKAKADLAKARLQQPPPVPPGQPPAKGAPKQGEGEKPVPPTPEPKGEPPVEE